MRSDCGVLLPFSCVLPSVSFYLGPVGYQVVLSVKIRMIHLTKMCYHTLTTLACCPTCGALRPCNGLASLRDILTAQQSPTLNRTSILELNELLLYASSPESAFLWTAWLSSWHEEVNRPPYVGSARKLFIEKELSETTTYSILIIRYQHASKQAFTI